MGILSGNGAKTTTYVISLVNIVGTHESSVYRNLIHGFIVIGVHISKRVFDSAGTF